MFMNEVARLHATCGDLHKCSKYLATAIEVLAIDKQAMKHALSQELHSQALHAAYMDIGYETTANVFRLKLFLCHI